MMRDTFDYRLADASYRANPSYWPASGTTVATKAIPRIVSESVGAAYLQGTMNIGHLNVLGGVRMEHTDVGGVGAYADPKSPTETSVRVDKAYQQWFPSIHLRYTVTPNFLLRGSYSTSGARPALSSVVPNTTVSYLTDGSGLGRVSQNNAGLKPPEKIGSERKIASLCPAVAFGADARVYTEDFLDHDDGGGRRFFRPSDIAVEMSVAFKCLH